MQNKNHALIIAFLIPMLLSGFVVMPLTATILIAGIMGGWGWWPNSLILIPVGGMLLLSMWPRHLLHRYGVSLPFHPVALFFISLVFNILFFIPASIILSLVVELSPLPH